MTNHQYHNREDGLQHCQVCDGIDASLPTHCPGQTIRPYTLFAIADGEADFVNGFWVDRSNPSLAMLRKLKRA